MPHDPEKYLYDMKQAAEAVLGFVQGKSFDEYLRDEMLQSAVERKLVILGEALHQLSRRSPEIAEQISEYQRIIGFRHVLVHGYDVIEHETIWHVAERKLAELLTEVSRLLPEALE